MIDKIKFYSTNYKDRMLIASKGKERYFELFENKIVTNYMIEKIFDKKIEHQLSWMT